MNSLDRALKVDEAITHLDFTSDTFEQDVLKNIDADRRIDNLRAAKGMIWAFIISVPLWLFAGITVVIYINR
ncbi:MAG: hypothetical protein A4E69_02013 [Syntrophus sp. PtaB.Bin138]|nr:MAG: hypothetical protein A4E69_02013 [Syntrophus sp. PtaB.Bin138]